MPNFGRKSEKNMIVLQSVLSKTDRISDTIAPSPPDFSLAYNLVLKTRPSHHRHYLMLSLVGK